jgi:flagellar hook-associated protein 1 FlgK
MSNIIGLLDLGRSALMTSQKALQTTGHNIANVNTPGYTRQRVNLAANPPLQQTSPGQMGTGVTAVEVARIYDRFISGQILAEQQTLGRWQARQESLQNAELSFDIQEGTGIDAALGDFWAGWQDLANKPGGHTERVALLSLADGLAQTFRRVDADLRQQQKNLDATIDDAVVRVNNTIRQLSELNGQIAEVEAGGQNANDLRDRRDLLLKDLTELIDVRTFEDGQGRVAVRLTDGRPLLDGNTVWQLSTAPDADGHSRIHWSDSGGGVDVTDRIRSGRLGGWLEVRDVELADYLGRIDTLAVSLINEVNARHTGGYDRLGRAGLDFFSGSGSRDLAVNPAIAAEPERVAAAATADGAPGDNANAVAIAGIKNSQLIGSATLDDYYSALVGDVGLTARVSSDFLHHKKVMTAALEEQRQSVSGVSLDEEMLNLIKFQHAYEAAAKLVTTVDEMLETVIQMAR